MKYKVSLLPESHRKRLNSKKKIEKIRVAALIVLLVLLALLIVVLGAKLYADKKLGSAQQLDSEYASKVEQLEQYRQINSDLQEQIALIDNIQVKDPKLYKFIVNLGNVDHPGVSISSIECSEWKTTRQCIITGTCDTRAQYLAYEQSLKKLCGITPEQESAAQAAEAAAEAAAAAAAAAATTAASSDTTVAGDATTVANTEATVAPVPQTEAGVYSLECQSYSSGVGSEDGKAQFTILISVPGGAAVITTAAPTTTASDESTTAAQ